MASEQYKQRHKELREKGPTFCPNHRSGGASIIMGQYGHYFWWCDEPGCEYGDKPMHHEEDQTLANLTIYG